MPDSFIDLSWLAGPTSRYPIDSSYSFDNLLETSLTDRNIWYKHLHGERKSRPPQFEGSFLRPYLGITWVLASWVWIPKSLDFDGCFSRFHVQILLENTLGIQPCLEPIGRIPLINWDQQSRCLAAISRLKDFGLSQTVSIAMRGSMHSRFWCWSHCIHIGTCSIALMTSIAQLI